MTQQSDDDLDNDNDDELMPGEEGLGGEDETEADASAGKLDDDTGDDTDEL